MSWNDRIKEAAYNSPSGVRVSLGFENVRRMVDKKTTGFNFPDANGTYVQDLGNTGYRYPLRVFFWGDNYDLEANIFEAALLENGIGKLDHPIYGTIDVIPFGTITRRDDLKTAANQAVVEVIFWETIRLVYPTVQTDPATSVLIAIDEYNDVVANEFEDVTSLDSAIEQSTLKNSYNALLDSADSGLQAIADTQDNVRKQFNAIVDSINNGIDILISDPLTLAFQTNQLIQAPARALTNIEARLDAYVSLANSIIIGNDAILSPGNDSSNSNKFHANDLYASGYVTGSIVSVINNQFTIKTEALVAAETILNQFDDLTVWRDANYQSLSEIDTGGAYQQLQEAVALTVGFLVEISFTLKQERHIVLDHSRTFIDLAAELYGEDFETMLDFFISSNDLSGSEIIELPRGRDIVFYV